MAGIRCPMCGERNPEDLEFCQWCDARLKPLEAVTGDHSNPGDNQGMPLTNDSYSESYVPDWLQSLREDVQPVPGETGSEKGGNRDELDSSAALVGADAPTPANVEGETPAPVSNSEDLPSDWLADLRDTAGEPVAQNDGSISSESGFLQGGTGWLSRLDGEISQPSMGSDSESADPRAGEDDIPSSPPESPSFEGPETGSEGNGNIKDQPPEEELPDWLESLQDKVSDTGGRLTGEDEVPDWLSTLPAIPVEAIPPDQNLEPGWLDDLKQESGEMNLPGESPSPLTEFQDSTFSQDAGEITTTEGKFPPVFTDEPSTSEDTFENIPEWLSAIQRDGKDAGGESLIARNMAALAEFPGARESEEPAPGRPTDHDQKDDSSSLPPTTATKASSIFSELENPDGNPLEIPEWISKLAMESDEELEASEPEVEKEDLNVAELPSWVQAMRPLESVVSDANPRIEKTAGEAESSGPLAGLRGVLPAGTGIEIGRKPPLYSHKLQVTDGQLKYATQLEKMITEEGQPKKHRHIRLTSNRLLRWVISILLLSAILIPLIADGQFTPDLKLFPAEWNATKTLLDSLPGQSPVLMVSDFEPALYGELQVSAAPVIERMVIKDARFSLVSTSPTGTALARQLLDTILEGHPQADLQVTNLGYLPGGPAGIYYFASSPVDAVPSLADGSLAWETPALQGVERFDDFALLLLLTDNADTGRAWIEQTRSFIGDTPILMVISAQAEPMLQPYYASGQVQGLITGLAGGKAYEQTYEQAGLARDYWDSFGLGTLTAVLMMTVGSVVAVGLALKSRKKGEKA